MILITRYNEALKNLFVVDDRISKVSNLFNTNPYRLINKESFDKNIIQILQCSILIYNLYLQFSGGSEFNRFRELQETLMRASAKGDPDTTSILTEIQQITNQLLESQKKPTITSNSGDEPSSTTTSFLNSSEPMQSNVAVNEFFLFFCR